MKKFLLALAFAGIALSPTFAASPAEEQVKAHIKAPGLYRRASLGAVVFQLPGRIEERRLDENGEGKSADAFLFRLRLG